jgi:AraC-like DNA-binding protein
MRGMVRFAEKTQVVPYGPQRMRRHDLPHGRQTDIDGQICSASERIKPVKDTPMNRNGTEKPLPTDGRRQSGALLGRKSRRAVNHESHVARKIEQSISYMLQHVNQPLQVAALAAAVNVSPSHYSALFKRWTGSPPIDYFIRLRMRHACQLFDSTSLNVKEVAGALGYDDPFYFSRTFKAINQIAPSEYRMMTKESRATVKSAAVPPVLPGPSDSPADQERFNGHRSANGRTKPSWEATVATLPVLEPARGAQRK